MAGRHPRCGGDWLGPVAAPEGPAYVCTSCGDESSETDLPRGTTMTSTTPAPDDTPAPRRGRPPVGRRFPMTLPDDLRAQLEAAAGESGRSLSAEIVARLGESFAPPRRARRNAAR